MQTKISNLTDDQSAMVRGIAKILLGVKDIDNRMKLAKDQIQKFKEEEIIFNYAGFLSMAGLDNSGEDVYMDIKTQPTHRVHKESTSLKDIMGELYSNPICPRKQNESDEAYKLRCAPLMGVSVLMNLPSVSELRVGDLVGGGYRYIIGSSEEKSLVQDRNYILDVIERSLRHYFYDKEFALNYLDGNGRKEYDRFFEKEVLTPMLRDIDNTLNSLYVISNDKVRIKLNGGQLRGVIDGMFKKKTKLPTDIKQAYRDYRLEYAGVKLKEEQIPMEEAMVRSVKDIVHTLIPKDTFGKFADDPSKNREWVNSLSKDMMTLLNRFYKEHDINVVVKL